MSENDPWKKVGTYAADICLDDGDLIDVDVCLRTEVDAARAAEATQHRQFKEAVATALCVENEHGPVTEESIVEAADATLSQLFDFSTRLATLRAERDRLEAANERLERLVKSQRPELSQLRDVECGLRAYLQNGAKQLERTHALVQSLLPPNDDDLPTFGELRGIMSAALSGEGTKP